MSDIKELEVSNKIKRNRNTVDSSDSEEIVVGFKKFKKSKKERDLTPVFVAAVTGMNPDQYFSGRLDTHDVANSVNPNHTIVKTHWVANVQNEKQATTAMKIVKTPRRVNNRSVTARSRGAK